MMGSDVSTNLAEELASSYLWQSAGLVDAVRNLTELMLFLARGGIRESSRLSYDLLPSN